jgi:hypothetical protein
VVRFDFFWEAQLVSELLERIEGIWAVGVVAYELEDGLHSEHRSVEKLGMVLKVLRSRRILVRRFGSGFVIGMSRACSVSERLCKLSLV